MRAGGCTVQQALTPEATSVIKQAVSLARRRGHAQVTPLHVASSMLSSSAGLLRAACLQSHSHPLQCKALELCFNVALNRLPASTSSGSMLGPPHHTHHHRHHPPSLSNALVAAFKRAQAHQRRGSVDTQQQPLLAVKIEIEQLIISILDDPSVSRVMREAGFSSTQVKNNVEQAVSLEICAAIPSKEYPSTTKADGNKNNSTILNKTRPYLDEVRNEDVASILDCLISRRKRNIVVVGECLSTAGGLVSKVMEKVNRGEVPESLKDVQFISVPLFSFEQISREEVEKKVGELRCLVNSCCLGRSSGVVLCLGDLEWAAEYRASCGHKMKSYCCPVDHAIMEIGRLACGGFGEEINGCGGGRVWLMGIATYQVYMRCRIGHPSLEAVWGVHSITVPAGNLGLSLTYDSDLQNQLRSKSSGENVLCWSSLEDGVKDQLNSCVHCSANFEMEAQSLPNSTRSNHGSITSALPSWLQQYKEETNQFITNKEGRTNPESRDLCRKWNSMCNSYHKHHHHVPERTLKFPSAPASPSSSCFDQHFSDLPYDHQAWSDPINNQQCPGIYLQGYQELSSVFLAHTNPSPSPIFMPSCDNMEVDYQPSFAELNAENLKQICNALEKKVYWQKKIIPEIASTVLQCRSGMMRRKSNPYSNTIRRDTWLSFLGGDVDGKEKISKELANLFFGSQSSLITIGMSSFSSTRLDSANDLQNKRLRPEGSDSYLERFTEAVCNNPHSIILMEDFEQVDHHSQMGLKDAIERGRTIATGREVCLSDSVVILNCENLDSRLRACSPPVKQKFDSEEEKGWNSEEASSCLSLDLNLSINDTEGDVRNSIDDFGSLLELVDRCFFFEFPGEL